MAIFCCFFGYKSKKIAKILSNYSNISKLASNIEKSKAYIKKWKEWQKNGVEMATILNKFLKIPSAGN